MTKLVDQQLKAERGDSATDDQVRNVGPNTARETQLHRFGSGRPRAILDCLAEHFPAGRPAGARAYSDHHRPSHDSSTHWHPDERFHRSSSDDIALSVGHFYEVTETEIITYAVRHGARDLSGMPGTG